MKNLLLFIVFLSSTFLCLSQEAKNYNPSNDILYDLKKGEFSDDIKKLKKGSTGDIYLKYFNPFMYTVDVNTKTIDTSKKIPIFITSLLGANFGLDIKTIIATEPGIKKSKKEAILDPLKQNAVNQFYLLYEKYLNTYTSLKQKTLDSKSFSIPPEGSLLKEYFKMIKITNKPFSNEKEQLIISLDTLINHLREYLKNHANSITKIGSFKISGEKIIINIKLTPRESVIEFATPLNIIKAKKVIPTDKEIYFWFSSGIMASKTIKTDYYINSTSSNEHEIMTEKIDNYLPGINSLLHVGFENSLKISFVIGGGVNIEGTPHVLLGGSFPLDESKNLSFNFGYGWAYIDTLSDKFSLNTIYTESPTIKTKKILNKEFWFGLSYKL